MHRHLMTLVTTGQPRSLRLEPPAQITAEVYVDERGRTREICHLAKLDSLSKPQLIPFPPERGDRRLLATAKDRVMVSMAHEGVMVFQAQLAFTRYQAAKAGGQPTPFSSDASVGTLLDTGAGESSPSDSKRQALNMRSSNPEHSLKQFAFGSGCIRQGVR